MVSIEKSHEWPLLSTPSTFSNETGTLGFKVFEPPSAGCLDSPVLVVGAGGLGCEVLKNLALSGVRNVHVVDMDTIDLTNLNRQFLFRLKDVGQPKAACAAAFITSRVPGCKVTPHECRIQDLGKQKELGGSQDAFWRQFGAVLGCLDNLDARRWVNNKLCSLAPLDAQGQLTALPIPYIDGGSEAFRGHVKVILPKFSACLECGIDTFAAPTVFQACTIASKPRKPEHCVAYVLEFEWEKNHPGRPINTDSREDIEWVNAQAQARAAHFGIEGVNYNFTLGAVKNIIPAIAATNAAVSAGAPCAPLKAAPPPPPSSSPLATLTTLFQPPPSTQTHHAAHMFSIGMVAEALKLLTGYSQSVDGQMGLIGEEGNFISTNPLSRRPECFGCGHNPVVTISLPPTATLETLLGKIAEQLQLEKPGLGVPGWSAFTLSAVLDQNLKRTVKELMAGYEGPLALTHPVYDFGKALCVKWE